MRRSCHDVAIVTATIMKTNTKNAKETYALEGIKLGAIIILQF